MHAWPLRMRIISAWMLSFCLFVFYWEEYYWVDWGGSGIKKKKRFLYIVLFHYPQVDSREEYYWVDWGGSGIKKKNGFYIIIVLFHYPQVHVFHYLQEYMYEVLLYYWVDLGGSGIKKKKNGFFILLFHYPQVDSRSMRSCCTTTDLPDWITSTSFVVLVFWGR